jgi:hypothetical protein
MLPKKGRREIVVDGILYHYVIHGWVSLIYRNSITGKIGHWYQDWKPKWKQQLKPSDVEKIIRGGDGDNKKNRNHPPTQDGIPIVEDWNY